MKKERILAIETSCDESAVALFDSEKGVLAETIHSQVDLHALYGGVVPDLASTQHLEKLPAILEKILSESGAKTFDRIVATSGPGLANCLAVGISAASALSVVSGLPLGGANHLRGHAYSSFIKIHESDPAAFEKRYFGELLPHLGLLVSGGNSIVFEISADNKISLLCDTLDDAAGEALDKGAKLLGMPYPGGALLEKNAKGGDYKKFSFPRGEHRKPEDDPSFSFSGVKTSLRYFLEKRGGIGEDLADICASYQYAVVEQLKGRVDFFLKRKAYKSFGLSGGVANNTYLRESLERVCAKRRVLFIPAERRYCGDNAAMIAFSAWIDPESCAQPFNSSLRLEPSKAISVQQ